MSEFVMVQTSNGHVVKIDAADLELVCKWSWFAMKKRNVFYACRNTYAGGGRAGRRTRRVYMHQQIMAAEGTIVDHLNGDGLDNRRCNLRFATASQNQRNRAGADVDSKSGIRGVCWHKQRGKWAASIRVDGKNVSLGLYACPEEAREARARGEEKYWSAQDRSRVAGAGT